MKKSFLLIGLLLVLIGFGIFVFDQPAGNSRNRHIVNIPSGMAFSKVAGLLQEKKLLSNRDWFIWLARLKGADRKVHPGEYELHAGLRPTEILSRLVDGQVYYHSVTIPEGYTVSQIATVLSEKELVQREKFIQLTRDQNFIKSLNVQAQSLEGYLFPDTYFLTRSASEEEIIKIFVSRLWEAFSPELIARGKEIGMTVQEVLTLASVVEKETGLSKERSMVSGVFHNRLQRNIPLQSDPTVIYALESFDGNIRKRDLSVKSPYNTYRVRGLPPGPIANPGEAAIRAALYPTPSDYVYFVSRNDGSHEFSVTLAEHNRAVEKYQKRRHKQAS